MAVEVDKYTKEQATEYANTEAEVRGFPVGSARWKDAFKDYLSFAVTTMSVGRNPRGAKYKVYTSLYPDIFGANGFAGKVEKNYRDQSGARGIPLNEVQNRVMSAVMNLAKLFENGILGTKNTTSGNRQGKIDNNQISELQLPTKEQGESDEAYEAKVEDVIRRWLTRDLITNAILESLAPFFSMTKADVDAVMDAIEAGNATLQDIHQGKRETFVKRLRAVVSPATARINYKKLIIG